MGRCGAKWVRITTLKRKMSATENNERISYKASYSHGVDEKRRVQIPAKWRPTQPDVRFTLMLWQPPGQQQACLLVLPPRAYGKLEEKLEAMSFSDPQAESLRRFLGENSDDVILDKGGRICLPEAMAKAAGIAGTAVLVGLFDRFQIWNPAYYETVKAADTALAPHAQKLI